MTVHLECAAETHVGMVRAHNEDALFFDDALGLCIVADGMGGHASGEVASRMAVDSLRAFVRETHGKGKTSDRLIAGIQQANEAIYGASENQPILHRMGTTIVGLLAGSDHVAVAHVGDSRAYRIRESHIQQLTIDHSLAGDRGPKNVLTRALGMDDLVDVDCELHPTRPGDVFVLCTDGLTGVVADDEILTIVATTRDLATACGRLIALANRGGGPDNVTVVAARIR